VELGFEAGPTQAAGQRSRKRALRTMSLPLYLYKKLENRKFLALVMRWRPATGHCTEINPHVPWSQIISERYAVDLWETIITFHVNPEYRGGMFLQILVIVT
jgi:hypothetical protein